MICNPLAAYPITTNMLKKERHAFIVKQINLQNKVLCADLSLQLHVST